MEKNFTEQDGLRVINEMIVQTRNNIQKGSSDSMIFAGYFVASTALLNFILLHTLTPTYLSFWSWLLMIPMSIGCTIISRKNAKQALVRTHVDTIVSKLWIAFTISVAIFLAIIFSFAISLNLWYITILITPVIMIMMGATQYATAITTRFKPFLTGAYVFWAGALLCLLGPILLKTDIQFLILAVCMIIGFVIPGHTLNRKAQQNV